MNFLLRPYHNPENVDESSVPDGWRFLYDDEAGKLQERPCKSWLGDIWGTSTYQGNSMSFTYIVPVNA